MNGCEYCRDDYASKPIYHVDGPIQRMDSSVWVVDDQIEIDLWGSGNIYVIIKINYCPMCGRKLTDEKEKTK